MTHYNLYVNTIHKTNYTAQNERRVDFGQLFSLIFLPKIQKIKRRNLTMAKKDYDPSRYKVEEIIENISESNSSNWGKFIIRASFDDKPSTIDIRNMKMGEEPIIGKGISLSDEEVDTVVNTLISKGYGNIDILQEEIKRRQKVFGGFNLSNEQEDEMFTVTFIED